MRRRILLLFFCFLYGPAALPAGNVTEARVIAEAAKGDNWFVKGGSFRGDHFSPLSDINDENVDRLGLAWAVDMPVPDGISATPIVVDGVIYLSGAFSVVFAVDAGSGRTLWSYDPEVKAAFAERPGLSWLARVNRGVAVWDGRVYATTADCRLIALDAATGRVEWTRRTCDPAQGYGISDSPYVGGGKVFVGNAGSESEEKNRGYVSAYDGKSGDLAWRFYIVPSDNPEENDTPALKMAAKTWSGDTLEKFGGGGNSWNEMTYDPDSDLLFFGTSGAVPYVYEQRTPGGGDNLFLSSIVAVRASTGEYVWHYQTVPQDSWDYNATMNIAVAELEIGGERRDAVLIAPKNGFHYALDKRSGELLSAGRFAKVNWASHINMETGRPVYDAAGEFWKAEVGETVLVWPNMWGAHSWNPMAFHPGLGLSYIPVVDVPSVVTPDGEGGYDDYNLMLTEVDGRPHSPGKLVAIDAATGAVRWTVHHALAWNGGVLATAGNLVFQGNGEGRFEAYAADSGERLWSVITGSAINAAPVSYRQDGTQYVLIPIGASGGVQFYYPQMHQTDDAKGPTRLLAFSLGGEADVPLPSIARRPLPEQPQLDADAETIATGKAYYNWMCSGCHGKDAVARANGSVPDLRWSDQATHEAWHAIVVGGSKRMNGMPSVEISIEESEAIRDYVLSRSQALRTGQE